MDADLAPPLSDDELVELAEFLASAATPATTMDLSMLDGFLTALAVGPNTLPPSRWLPAIWGDEMVWDSSARAERILALILRHANSILFGLRANPPTFSPLLYEHERAGTRQAAIEAWCVGFVRGMALDAAAWRPIEDDDKGSSWLFPILLFGTAAGARILQENPILAERQDDYAAQLGEYVIAIMRWWLPRRRAAGANRRTAIRTGRNDPCPCGSGKKFKHCCGGPKTVH